MSNHDTLNGFSGPLAQAMRQHEHAFGAGHALLAPVLIEMGDTALTERLLLVVGDTVEIAGHSYRVREVIALRDGNECRARLARL